MILRPYQDNAIRDVLQALPNRPVLVAPTGSGKTVMGVEILRRAGGTALWIAHRRELIAQAAERLVASGLDVGIVMAGHTESPGAQVQVASVQTLARRAMPRVTGLVVIDEAHHARAESYRGVLDHYVRGLGLPLLGLTATPFRLDGKGLGDVFGQLVVAASTRELVFNGTLIAPRVFSHPAPDMAGVSKVGGDYVQSQAADRMSTPKLIGDIVATWQKRAAGVRTVLFAVNVEHSKRLIAAFVEAGVRAEHLDGGTPKVERDAILKRLRSGETTIVSNCMVLTEGWDLPALECAIVARPTASLCLHLQMIGRIMRSCEGKTGALVLDHAGNHQRLGGVLQELEYNLSDTERVTRKERDALSDLKRCPECFMLVDRDCVMCPECWHSFLNKRGEIETDPEKDLVEFKERTPATREEMQAYWERTCVEAIQRGYAEGWAYHRFKDRFGFFPNLVDGRVVDARTASREERHAIYQRLVTVARQRGYKEGWAKHRYRAQFGVWPRF